HFPFLPRCPRARLRGNSCARQLRRLCFIRLLPKNLSQFAEIFRAPPKKRRLALGAAPSRFSVPRVTGAEKEIFEMYLNSVQIIGFIGKDPERRQARSNGAAFTVLRSPRNGHGRMRTT